VTQQFFLRQNTLDLKAADQWASCSPDLNPLDYCIWNTLKDLVCEGRRLSFANLQDLKEAVKNKSCGRSPLRQFENPLHNGKTHEWGQKAEWRRDSAHFPLGLITVTGYRLMQ